MQYLQGFEMNEHKEELLPGFSEDFPYLSSCAELDKYVGSFVPWHWHRVVELFYVQSGTLEYATPKGSYVFPAGSGGFVNSNVLHSTRVIPSQDSTVQLLHLFDPTFLSGERGSRIETKYILPLTAAADAQIIPLYPDDPTQAEILQDIRDAFALSEEDWGYELHLRQALTHIWLNLFALAHTAIEQDSGRDETDSKIKQLLIYIHHHYHEPLTVEQLAAHIHISKRGCFRLFQEYLHTTPTAYIRSCRLQRACTLLTGTSDSMTQIALSCGFGTSSHFGKCFRDAFGCTPLEYRRCWHDHEKNWR